MKSPPASFKIILAPNVWLLSHLTDEPEPVMTGGADRTVSGLVFSGQQKENMRQSVQRAVNRFPWSCAEDSGFWAKPSLDNACIC